MEENKKEDVQKKIDDAWKEAVEKEKTSSGVKSDSEKMPEVSFQLFISGLMMEALVAFGDMENPLTKKKELNAPHAKFVVDTLGLLKEKTKGNLTKDEEESLEAVLYELRLRYVNKTSK